MEKNKKFLLFWVALGLWSSPLTFASSDKSQIQEDLLKIINQSGVKKDHLSLYARTTTGKEIWSLNGSKNMIPASITKLVTAAYVLDAFGPDHQFKTKIMSVGSQNGDVLKGDIYLKGGGDPGFVSEKMWMLVNDFTRTGIKKITGNIYADDSYFDDEKFDEGRENVRNDRAYDAPLSALSFNWNSVTIYVRPGKSAGDDAKVWADPENEYVVVKSNVTTSGQSTQVSAERKSKNGQDVLVVSGKIATGSSEKHIYKNITEPAIYAAYNLKSFLKQRGIEVQGVIKKGVTPGSAKLESEVESERLSQLMTSQNKFSNNFVAEMLSKNVAAQKNGPPGRMKAAIEGARKFLIEKVGLKAGTFELVNLSGFTRENSFSSNHFVEVLSWAHRTMALSPEFIQSLPIAGADGTLEKRFKGLSGFRKIRAKTGLLNGVASLAGFASRGPGEEIVFSFIFNGGENEAHVRSIFDKLASRLTEAE